MTTPALPSRRHDIDALRALAFGLLILYHWGMLYVGGNDWDWHLKSLHTTEAIQLPMLLVNRWRMDLIFLVSGLSVHFLMRQTSIGRFIRLRTWRLLLPLAFGILVIVPIQPYAQGVANGLVAPGFWTFLARYYSGSTWPPGAFDGWQYGFTWNHLWYLAYLWVYSVVFALLLPLLRRLPNPFAHLRGKSLLLLPALPLMVFTILLQPHFPDTGDLVHDWFRHSVYFSVFLYGWWIGTQEGVWSEFVRMRRVALVCALGLFATYIVLLFTLPEGGTWGPIAARTLRSFYIWWMLSAILGYARKYLDRPFRWLPWANEAVYPWYVLHQTMIIACAMVLLPMHLGPVVEPALVLIGTVAGCALVFAVVKRTPVLRPLFGMKWRPREEAAASSTESNVPAIA